MFIDLTNEKEKKFDERNKLCNFLLTHATTKTDWNRKAKLTKHKLTVLETTKTTLKKNPDIKIE